MTDRQEKFKNLARRLCDLMNREREIKLEISEVMLELKNLTATSDTSEE